MFKQLFHAFPHKNEGSFISHQFQSAKQLHDSELKYRRLFETAQDGILILDGISGKIVDVNPFLTRLLGYSQKEFLGKQLWEIGVFNDIVDSKAAFVELQDKGYIRYKDLPLQTKDGRLIDVEFVSNVYMENKERVIQCNIRDISDRKKAEEIARAKAEELERMSKSQDETKLAMLNVVEDLEEAKSNIEREKAKDDAMLESIGEGLIAVDTLGNVMIMNKTAEHMLGRNTKEIIGRTLTSFPLEDEEGHLIPIEKRPTTIALSSGQTVNVVYYLVRKDKTRFPIAITATPIKLKGKTIGLIEIFRDITREKEVDRAKTEFVSLASHQLRTPLGIAKWYLEAVIAEEYIRKSPETIQDYLNEVYKSNERLLVLVRDLLSISRIDQGKVRDTPRLVNITQIVKRVVKEMRILALKNEISIRLQIKDPNIQSLYIDPLRVQEVIENLVTNAITYSYPSGIVEVILDKKDDMVNLSVKDTGVGMTREDRRKLFTKFFRSERAIAKNTEGAGLGLYVVKSYIEGWGGTISVSSTKGKGSTFTITLPVKMKRT